MSEGVWFFLGWVLGGIAVIFLKRIPSPQKFRSLSDTDNDTEVPQFQITKCPKCGHEYIVERKDG